MEREVNNEVLNTIISRSSIRAYTDEVLTSEELSMLSDAALASPTAMNRQNQRFYFVTDKSLISEIEKLVADELEANNETDMLERLKSRNGKVIYNAPLFVVIAADTSSKYAGVDAGIAVQSLALCAKSMGLDSVILGMPSIAFLGSKREYLKEKLGIEEKYDFVIAIAIGHAAMDKTPHESDSSHVIYVRGV